MNFDRKSSMFWATALIAIMAMIKSFLVLFNIEVSDVFMENLYAAFFGVIVVLGVVGVLNKDGIVDEERQKKEAEEAMKAAEDKLAQHKPPAKKEEKEKKEA